MWPILVAVPIAWLLGTFPTAMIVARANGVDITTVGSGNPGASNVLRAIGGRAFAVVMVGDFLKGALSAGAGLAIGGRVGAYTLGVAAIAGHMFPLWRKGGKGVAAAGGMVVVLFPWITLGLAIVWAVIGRLLRKASLASLTTTIASPILVAVTGHDPWEIVVTSVVAAVLVVQHRHNIVLLARGQEQDLRAPPED